MVLRPGRVRKEKKVTPDLWQISYAVTKRRAGRAPEGSGVPVGTEYHWYILTHQNVEKLKANDYTTSMTGLKFKSGVLDETRVEKLSNQIEAVGACSLAIMPASLTHERRSAAAVR